MAKSTKHKISIGLGTTKEEHDRRVQSLRSMAKEGGFTQGRYGGSISAMMVAIADLPPLQQRAIVALINIFRKGG